MKKSENVSVNVAPIDTMVTNNVKYDIKVLSAREVSEGKVAFNMMVNNITIYGCWYHEFTNKAGKDDYIISFPSQKAENGNYYNHCWFDVNPYKAYIKAQLETMV